MIANVALGDVNGDGLDDIVATSRSEQYLDGAFAHLVSVFINRNGSFQATPLQIPTYRGFVESNPILLEDLDHDGKAEIIVGKLKGIAVLRETVPGQFSLTPHEGINECRYAVSGDLNSDGNTDVICHDWKTSANVFLGTDAAGFRNSVYVPTPAGNYTDSYKQMQLKDVTGDGAPDFLITASSVNSFFVHENDGYGNLLTARAYPHPRGMTVWPASIEALDIDGDGATEIVTANPYNQPDARLYVYRRQNTGFFELSTSLPLHDSTTALRAHDVDGDGDEDLAAGHFEFNAVGWLLNEDGRLESERLSTATGFAGHANAIALGRIDGDDCADMAVALTGAIAIGRGICVLRIRADYNGDERSDIAWHNRGNGQGSLWYSANAQTQRSLRTVTDRAWTVAGRGDFDGDGSSDLLWRNSTTGANAIWKGGDYAWQIPVTTVTNTQWAVAGIGDFNFDGRDDIFWRNASTGANVIWHSGDSTTQQSVMGVSGNKWQVADIGDFDGDGRDDVLWRNTSTGANTIWKAGNYEAQQPMTPAMTAWRVAGSGDFDGDGRDDVVWRHATTGANELWPGGNATSKISLTSVTNLAWQVVAAGDYDGDGKDDLLWRNPSNGQNVIWRSANYNQQLKVDPRTGADWRVTP
ncbi:VCBS repeat protein [Pseudoxanthomonas sp. 3HH-4]|nr:VCBS repeat protein [Pseudoxanthomonas sp. 3HH-4]